MDINFNLSPQIDGGGTTVNLTWKEQKCRALCNSTYALVRM